VLDLIMGYELFARFYKKGLGFKPFPNPSEYITIRHLMVNLGLWRQASEIS